MLGSNITSTAFIKACFSFSIEISRPTSLVDDDDENWQMLAIVGYWWNDGNKCIEQLTNRRLVELLKPGQKLHLTLPDAPEPWGLYYKTLRITEKEKIYRSIFSVTIFN